MFSRKYDPEPIQGSLVEIQLVKALDLMKTGVPQEGTAGRNCFLQIRNFRNIAQHGDANMQKSKLYWIEVQRIKNSKVLLHSYSPHLQLHHSPSQEEL